MKNQVHRTIVSGKLPGTPPSNSDNLEGVSALSRGLQGVCTHLADRYAAELFQRTGKQASVAHFRNAVRLYVRSQGEGIPTRESLRRFVTDRLDAGAKPVTVNGNLRQLKVLLRANGIDAEIFRGVAPKATRKLPKLLPYSDTEKLLKAAEDSRIYPILRIASETGMRLAEVWNLRVKDVDAQKYTLSVHANEQWTPKSHTERTIPADALFPWLLTLTKGRAKNAWLCDRGNGEQWTPGSYFRIQRPLFQSLGLKVKGTHALRHGIATELLSRGASIVDVQSLLGHSSIQTTMGYLHSDIRSMKTALAKLRS